MATFTTTPNQFFRDIKTRFLLDVIVAANESL